MAPCGQQAGIIPHWGSWRILPEREDLDSLAESKAAACSWSCPPGEEMFGPSVVCTVTLFLSVLRQDYEFPFISAQRVTVCCGAL